MSNSFIWVTFQKEGIHCYPAAAADANLTSVSFLGSEHRHIFHFKVWIEVFHDDRDIEFIQFKRWLESLYAESILEMNHKSCEMLSNDLYSNITKKYPNRDIKISVSEDNENGSEIFYPKNSTQEEQTEEDTSTKTAETKTDSSVDNKSKIDLSTIKFNTSILPDLSKLLQEVRNVQDKGTMYNITQKMIDTIKKGTTK